MLAGGSMDLRFFHRLGATLLDRPPLCGGIRSEAWAGTFGAATPGIPPEQVEHSRLIVAWGYNVTWADLHLTPLIDRARRNGARLVVIDPKRTKIAERADLHLAVKPGTDVVLAWAVAAALERRAGSTAPSSTATSRATRSTWRWPGRRRSTRPRASAGCRRRPIQQFADWVRTISPLATAVGNGLERNQNGGSSIRAVVRAARAGRQVRRDGRRPRQRRAASSSEDTRQAGAAGLVPPGTRTLNIVDVGRTCRSRAWRRRSRRSSSTTTTRSWCIRTRTGCGAD